MNPVLLLVSGDREELNAVTRRLAERFGHDYTVEPCLSPSEGRSRLHELRDAGAPIAMVLADLSMGGRAAIDFAGEARSIVPTAVRIVLHNRSDRAAWMAARQAAALGRVDAGLSKPTAARDEDFFAAITEYLAEWAWVAGEVVDAVRVVGDARDQDVKVMVDLLRRHGIPSSVYHPNSAAGRDVLQHAPANLPLPAVQILDDEPLGNPSLQQLADQFGFVRDVDQSAHDLVIIGAGPAGLGAAVYGASEGLDTLVIEQEALGGQAATSSMIRNYLGFPRGLSGRQLASRGSTQALRFGAAFHLLRAVNALEPCDGDLRVSLSTGAHVRARAVLLACGVAYRRLGVPALEALVGAGVFYGAAVGSAQALTGLDVYVVGAGNSAGQAAVHLARYAARVTILVRGDSLARSMSNYLVEEIAAHERITVRTRTEVVDGGGSGHLEWLTLRDDASGEQTVVPAAGLFILIGAEPRTGWLASGGTVARDARGFIVTGSAIPRDRWPLRRAPLAFETTLPKVFAAGDVRAGSVKRVAAAVGEGSVVVSMVHSVLTGNGAT